MFHVGDASINDGEDCVSLLFIKLYAQSHVVSFTSHRADLIGRGQGLEPVVLLLFVRQRGLGRDVFMFGLLQRDGIRRLKTRN